MPPTDSSSCRQVDLHCHDLKTSTAIQILSLDALDVAGDGRIADLSACYLSIGVHPWFIKRQDWRVALQILIGMRQNPNMLAVGECGLDKCIATPMALQVEVFGRQIELAEELAKPLIVHCVRAFGDLLQMKKSYAPRQPWIIHGFAGKPGLAGQLLRQGCYLSFGKALLHPGSPASQALAVTPIDRVFLETDADETISIGEVYAAAAKILGLELDELERRLLDNFQRVFLHD